MKTRVVIGILLLCLTLTAVTACNPFSGDQDKVTEQLVEVVRGDLMVSVSGSGNIVVSDEANLAFGTSGKIARIYIEEGDDANKGELLAKLDTGPVELALAQAQTALDQAEYNLEKTKEPYSEDDIDSAEAAVEAAEKGLEYAEWMLDKSEDAVEDAEDVLAEATGDDIATAEAQLAVAEAAVEQWRTEMSRAEASLIAAEVQLEAMLDAPDEGAVKAAESQLKAARQAVAEAQKQLDEAVITAPFDGEIVNVFADEGDIITPAVPIIHLIDPTVMEIEVEVDEIDIAEVKVGQRVVIEVDALPTLQLEGRVTSISALSIETGGVVLYEVTIGFDVPSGSGLKLGMSATADIIIKEASNVLLVPSRAITEDSEGNPVVKVIVNEEIEERQVTTGISDGFDTEIVYGLNEGETVLAEAKARASGSGGLFG